MPWKDMRNNYESIQGFTQETGKSTVSTIFYTPGEPTCAYHKLREGSFSQKENKRGWGR